MASGSAAVASPGALQNITSLLPPSLQAYVDSTIANLAAAFSDSSEYISATLGVPPNTLLYSTLACVGVAIPVAMSHYGWPRGREPISPYASFNTSGGVPNITDEDFSYITSEDLEDTAVPAHHRGRSHSAAPEDDILVIKNKGVTYPAHFPAYSIGDGKLRVRDVEDRVAVMMELSERRKRRIKMVYKGKILKDTAAPIRDYGVKNNSEVMVVVPELGPAGQDDVSIGSGSDEEMVVVAEGSGRGSVTSLNEEKKKRKRKPKTRTRGGNNDYDSTSSPRDSGSNLGVPGSDAGGGDGGRGSKRSPSPNKAVSVAMGKIDGISSHFTTKLLPQCVQFTAAPPTDAKKRQDEHRKLSETVMQQVLLKLDEVETNGDEEARMKRRSLVRQVQDVLKGMDGRLHG